MHNYDPGTHFALHTGFQSERCDTTPSHRMVPVYTSGHPANGRRSHQQKRTDLCLNLCGELCVLPKD